MNWILQHWLQVFGIVALTLMFLTIGLALLIVYWGLRESERHEAEQDAIAKRYPRAVERKRAS